MKKINKFLSILLATILILSLFPVTLAHASDNTVTFSAETDVVSAKAGDIVNVDIRMSENSVVAALTLIVNYDNTALKILNVQSKEAFGYEEFNTAYGNNKLAYLTASATPKTIGGTLFTIQFEVLKDGCTEISLSVKELADIDLQPIPSSTQSVKIHNYETEITPPTCTEDGFTTYTCACGDTYIDDYVDALGHIDGDVVEENYVAPTCTESGSKDNVTYCAVCGVETGREQKNILATNHIWMPATCTSKATCSVCGETNGSTISHNYDIVCDETSGESINKCVVCGFVPVGSLSVPTFTLTPDITNPQPGDIISVEVEVSNYSKLGYLCLDLNYDSTAFEVVDVESNHVFGYSYNEAINSALPSKIRFVGAVSNHISDFAPAIFVAQFKVLESCGAMQLSFDEVGIVDINNNIKEVSAATNTLSTPVYIHCNIKEEITKKPTCIETGTKVYYCNCGIINSEEIPAKGHSYNEEITKPATHTENGVMTYTCACGDSYTETINATGDHYYAPEITSPTCTEAGYTTYTCVCGDTYIDDETQAKGHSFSNGSCTVCGETDPDYYVFSVKEPSKTTIRNKDGIILHAEIEGNAPAGSYVEWTSSNSNFDKTVMNDGKSMRIIANNKGNTTFTATLYDVNGNVLATDTVELYSQSGFFDKIVGFFRSLFGTTKNYES